MKNFFFLLLTYSGLCGAYYFAPYPIGFIGELIREKCDNKDDLYLALVNIKNKTTCSLSDIQKYEVDREAIEDFRQNGSLPEFFKRYSIWIHKLHQCQAPLYKLGMECLSFEDREYVNKTREAHNELVIYIFDNDSQRSIAFVQAGGVTCQVNNANRTVKWLEIFPTHRDWNNTKSKFCKFYSNLKLCVLDTQKRCPNTTSFLLHIFDSLTSAFCDPPKRVQGETRAWQYLSILEYQIDALLSFFPQEIRITRETGGLGTKLLHMERAFKNKCEQNITELERALGNMKNCLRSKRMFETPRDMFVRHIDHCSKETRRLLGLCVPENIRYFPEMLFKLTESIAKLLYDDYDEIARGLTPCVSKLKSIKGEIYYFNCTVIGGDTYDTHGIPESKKQFCNKFIPITECFVRQINDMCASSSDLQKFNKDYLKAMREPCT